MDLKQFLELFNPYPGSHYLQVTTKVDETTQALSDLMQSSNSEFSLVVYGKSQEDHKKQFDQPFRALPRSCDIIIFKDFFHLHKNPKGVLKIAYTALANAGEIIIMQEKGTMDREVTLSLLEEFEFRSQNYIDVLPEYDLVMAKKLHMWGNGL